VLALGERPAKATVGEPFEVAATVVGEGHDLVGAEVVLVAPDGSQAPPVRMAEGVPGTDRRHAWVTPDRPGLWHFRVQAWGDPIATWQHRAQLKVPAGIDTDLELEEGARLYERLLKGLPRGKVRTPVKEAVLGLRDTGRAPAERLVAATAAPVTDVVARHPLRLHLTTTRDHPVLVERERALYGSWYEFFPRSEGATLEPPVSGTLASAAERLPAIAAMGFDVVYLPPIHPIGTSYRKGPNNTLDARPGDPGSPWAIGSPDGGHDAVHPDLGTVDDFRAFVARAAELGLEVALDLALQCSPDHPWVREHPDWFVQRADGSIAYAENPPKKYQDIYPMHFDADPDGIFAEVLRVVHHWMGCGVRIFRVDNPHTKPVMFWERLIGEVNRTDPDVIFLAEAFTRPAMMRLLGEVGFQQSYTYFTWRNEKWELEEYLRELAGPLAASMRPNFFVNTPDILTAYLQNGGPAAFAIRATLAATLSPTWGVYSGFELVEHVAVRPGSEEYLDSEKYQYRPRDWAAAEADGRSLAPYLTALNTWRREHPALQLLRNLRFHQVDNDAVIAYSKRHGDDCILVVCTLDPYGTREATVHLDLDALGIAPAAYFPDNQLSDEPVVDRRFVAHDLVSGESWSWGAHNYVRLDPHVAVAHVFHVRSGDDA
jgi:starch synthase (maltosyl-transferring)